MKKKILLTFTLLFSMAFANNNAPDYKAYILGDSKGRVYYESNGEEKIPLASVTKMMNLMVVFDEIHKGNINLNDRVTVDWESVSAGGSSIPMKSGDTFLLIDLIKAAAIKSANNAAYALAKYAGGGSIDNFIHKMNAKAKELGLENELEFHTPSGLPSHMTKKPMDVGTAKGIYLLSIEAIKYKDYMNIASRPKETIKNGEISLRSTNHLLGKEGVYGIKTGYHTRSGFNIAIASNKDGIDVLTVVLGGKSIKMRDGKVMDLLQKYHDKYKFKKMVDMDDALISIPVKNGVKTAVDVYPTKDFGDVITVDSDVRLQIDRAPVILAPIKAGTVVGEYSVYIDGKKAFTDSLIVKENIEKKNMVEILKDKFIKK